APGLVALTACGLACGPACGRDLAPAPPRPLRFLHTFGPREVDLLRDALATWPAPAPVAMSLVPFARGQTVIGALLRAGRDCPDLIRIDATWLPALLEDRLLAPAPAELAARDWLPEARELASDHGAMWAAPQTVDGLIVVRGRGMRREDGAPATPATLDQLL